MTPAALELMPRIFQRLVWLDEGLQKRLHDAGWPDVSRAQSMVMLNVTSGNVRPAEIARSLGVSRQAVHVTIGQMTELGILTLIADPANGRNKLVQLTAFGEEMRRAAQQAMTAMLTTLEGRIGCDRLEALVDALVADWGPSE